MSIPNPDLAKSYEERKRLLNLPRSGWIDFDPKLILRGGVFERSAKYVKLRREIKQALGIERDSVTPNGLIKAILLAHLDLLWFGGIGTYIKAASESDSDAGDRANDPIRVNGGELNCKVVGEGTNLGAIRRGRVEFAMAGGRLNTDFIDDSAGDDYSDHEVNIKVVFGDIVQRGDMTMKQRDKLLMKITDEAGTLVSCDIYQQTQAMRLSMNVRMTWPEISVLLSYAKIVTCNEIFASDLPDEKLLAEDFLLYFSTPLRKTY